MKKESKLKNEVKKELDEMNIPYEENYEVTIKHGDKEVKTDAETIEKVSKGLKNGSMKLPSENKEDQQHLFGEADLVFNALSTEVTLVNEEMAKVRGMIDRKKQELEMLSKRKETLEKATAIAKKNIKKDELELNKEDAQEKEQKK